MGTVFIEITCADIDSRSFQVRCDHRDVAERAGVLLETEAANELREVRVIAVIEYGVISAAPIQFNDIVDLRTQLAVGKFPCTHTAELLVFAKQDMTMALAHQHQDHIHTGTVITADPVGRHQVASILGAADDIRPMGMNRVQMGDQQHGDSTFCIKKSAFADGFIVVRAQLLHKMLFQLALGHLQDAFKMGYTHSHNVVFHSLRHSSTTYKLKLNHGDIKATQGDTGHSQADMVTKVYAHILDEDRKVNAQKFESAFYANPDLRSVKAPDEPQTALDVQSIIVQLQQSPELLGALTSLISNQGCK